MIELANEKRLLEVSLIACWIALAVACALYARHRRRSQFVWYLFGATIPLLAFLALWILPKGKRGSSNMSRSSHDKGAYITIPSSRNPVLTHMAARRQQVPKRDLLSATNLLIGQAIALAGIGIAFSQTAIQWLTADYVFRANLQNNIIERCGEAQRIASNFGYIFSPSIVKDWDSKSDVNELILGFPDIERDLSSIRNTFNVFSMIDDESDRKFSAMTEEVYQSVEENISESDYDILNSIYIEDRNMRMVLMYLSGVVRGQKAILGSSQELNLEFTKNTFLTMHYTFTTIASGLRPYCRSAIRFYDR